MWTVLSAATIDTGVTDLRRRLTTLTRLREVLVRQQPLCVVVARHGRGNLKAEIRLRNLTLVTAECNKIVCTCYSSQNAMLINMNAFEVFTFYSCKNRKGRMHSAGSHVPYDREA